MWRICLDVRRSLLSVEYIIRRVMDKTSVGLTAGYGEVTNRESVRLVGGKRLALGDVYLVICGRVDNNLGIRLPHSFFHAARVCNVERLPVKALYCPTPVLKFAAKLDTELSAASENNGLALH